MTVIRNLLGLIITITMLPICIQAFVFTSNIDFDYNQINDEIALAQLREQLLISYDMQISNNQLNFIYKNKEYRLSLVNEKLILQPGTQIYLNDVEYLFFEERNGCIYVVYSKNNTEYERIICKKEGIYLNNFLDCDVYSDDDSEYEE